MQKIATTPPLAVGCDAALTAAGIAWEIRPSGVYVADAQVSEAQALINGYAGSANELAYHKSAKIAALEAQYNSIIAAGRLYSVSGGTDSSQHTYQIDAVAPIDPATGLPTRRDSQSTVTTMGMWALNVVTDVANTAPWPSGFSWQDVNNVGVPMTASECYDFTQNVAAYVGAIDLNFFTLRATINAQTTTAAVDAIDVTQGWPSNP